MDYNKLMKEEMSSIPKGTKLLLHACCAPCSSAVLERLHDVFDITIYYYNPNITDKDEYQKRLDEIHNFVNKLNIGKFKIRMPKDLHKHLANKAKSEGVSMNQYCVYLLSKNDAVYSR